MRLYIVGFMMTTNELKYEGEIEISERAISNIMNWANVHENIGAEFSLDSEKVRLIEQEAGLSLPNNMALFLSINEI